MEACIDTFSNVFNNVTECRNSSRNGGSFIGFENACQFPGANNSGSNAINGHYHQQQRQAGAIMFSNSEYLNSGLPSMSWSDRQMNSNYSNKLEVSSSTTTGNHGFHPFANSTSAAFNLQQLQHGISSVGNMPSWQQAFAFNDCASTSVPSQNDETNDTRIPMPLSMSSVPTSSSNGLANGHSSSTNNNNNNNNNNNELGYLNSAQPMRCPPTSQVSSSNLQPTEHQGNQFNVESSFKNHSGNMVGQLSSQPQNTLTNGTTALSFSATLLNTNSGAGTPCSQTSPLPYVTSPTLRPTDSASYSTSDYAKMPTSTRNVRLRANTKLDMDRQKAQEEERRDKELQKTQRAPSQSTSVPVSLPSVNVVVPPRVLQVHSALENPTPFHVEQKRRLNIQQYIANSLPDAHASSLGASVAPLRHPVKHNRIQHIVADGAVSSAPPNYSTTPLSPVSALEPGAAPSPGPSQRSSVATSVNDEYEESILMELQELLMNDEKSGDQFNKSDQVASLPQPGFNRVSGVPEASSSCPADSTKDANGDPVKVTKDRIKKDNHNKIERKRRFHINDMITEQGRLLPKQNERHHEIIGDVKQNKGSILKASVDYTKALKHDNENLFHKLQNIELENKALLLKLKHLEQFCKQSGLQLPENIITWKSCSSPEELNALLSNDVVKIKQEPITYPVDDICDIMDEDRSIVTGSSDPMFGQPVEADDGFHHPEGMDFND
ncbi:unnamed protein product [Orchesella dallaii]|uniref:BHLH domain-containing protein n=1 Tax=Orchesella dallaii TaxID=48710 RepID=A0ABP1PZC7_9HEXA